MKKVITFLLMLAITISVVACGNSKEKIELTVENYDTYLDVTTEITPNTSSTLRADGIPFYGASDFDCMITIDGSDNFNYYDVSIDIEYTITAYGMYYVESEDYLFDETGEASVEKTITVKANISGEGSESKTIYLVSNNDELDDYFITAEEYILSDFEITAVHGYVTPA